MSLSSDIARGNTDTERVGGRKGSDLGLALLIFEQACQQAGDAKRRFFEKTKPK